SRATPVATILLLLLRAAAPATLFPYSTLFRSFRDFEGMPEPQRSKVFARAERKFDVMEELGCDLLMVCSNVSPDSLGGIERAARSEEHTSELQSRENLVCRLLPEKKTRSTSSA